MRELAIQASSEGTQQQADRDFLNEEFGDLKSELNRIVNVTKYNDQSLVDGTISGGISFQVGSMNSSDDRISLSVNDIDSTALGIHSSALDSAANAQTAVTALDNAIKTVNTERSNLGATQNRLEMTISNLGSQHMNLSAANSRLKDVGVAAESAEMTRAQILSQAGVSVLAQANQIPQAALSLLG